MHPEFFFVHIVASRNRRTQYIGVTSDLVRRVYEHKFGPIEGFSKRYHCVDLIYYEEWGGIADAISREKQLKRWHRPWKNNLIESMNPAAVDLAANWGR